MFLGIVVKVLVVRIRGLPLPRPRPCALVFELQQNDVAAAVNLVCSDAGQDLGQPMVLQSDVARVVPAYDHAGLELRPHRVSARIPLGANVGADAHRNIEPQVLRRLEVSFEVLFPAEIEPVLLRLVVVPENVGLDRVESAPRHAQQAVAPKVLGHPRIMNGTRVQVRSLAADDEALAVKIDGRPRAGRGCKHGVVGLHPRKPAARGNIAEPSKSHGRPGHGKHLGLGLSDSPPAGKTANFTNTRPADGVGILGGQPHSSTRPCGVNSGTARAFQERGSAVQIQSSVESAVNGSRTRSPYVDDSPATRGPAAIAQWPR